MKILYLDHPEADFLSAIVYTGLCELLGADNVVDYPRKKSYHGECHRYPSIYTRDPGSMPWQHWDGNGDGVTSPFAWMQTHESKEWSRQEVIDRISEFSLAILASPRKYNGEALAELVRVVGRGRLPPLVMMDGEDYQDILPEAIEQFRPKVFFKRELLPKAKHSAEARFRIRVEPCPFASPVVLPPEPVAKDIDVLFLGGGTWPGRSEACDALRRAFGDRFVGGVGSHRSHSEYLSTISRARVAVSVRGHGYDTLRYYEIPAMPGTLMIADRQPILRPYPFEHESSALLFDNASQLVVLAQRALDDEPWRAKLAAAGNAWLNEHHTARARARQLLTASGV